ncbi:MAG: SDR family NAD(P)-dependent oxidoreductase [Myxococcota bacterium]|nr:SDR family NAD(P)-dependent oxidoreductase [Myxococcota bacterium]
MNRKFDAESTTDQVIEGIDLSGKKALVTGASGGLGAETARALCQAGAEVTLAARDVEKAEGVAASIRESQPAARVAVAHLDLTSLDDIRQCADGILRTHDSLDLLVNNAGVMACPLIRTENGWELQLATNHIGHFLLTGRLLPALQAGPSARIVNLSSAGHRLDGMHFEDPHFENREYDKWAAYGQSKTANVLFTVELDQRLAQQGIRAFAVHPGMIMTELARHMQESDFKDLMDRSGPTSGHMSFKPVEAGAATSVWAATAPELEGQGGLYCEDCGVAETKESDDSLKGFSPHAVDPESAQQLWVRSEEWVNEKFL